jgi:hypothetical protein
VTTGIEKHQCEHKNESLQFSTTQGNARNFENGELLQMECEELSKGNNFKGNVRNFENGEQLQREIPVNPRAVMIRAA